MCEPVAQLRHRARPRDSDSRSKADPRGPDIDVTPGPRKAAGRRFAAFRALAQVLLGERTMSSNHRVLALVLLPCITFAPGCDEFSKKGSASEGTGGMESTGDTEDSEGDTDGATDGEAGSSTTDEAPPPVKPDPVAPCDEDAWSGTACTAAGGVEGTSFCIVVDGKEVQTPCYPDLEIPCYPGDSFDQGCLGHICAWDGTNLYSHDWSEPNCDTPLVVDFAGGPLQFEPVGAASFDIMGASECAATDWPVLPWLALDRDGDGAISDGRELFGSGTVMATGLRAADGFQALAELDADRDGKLTAADPAFADLVLWTDRDGDRRGELAELLPVREASLVAIDLAYASRVECDERGNCGRERARFEFRAPTGEVRTGEIVDVYLACQ